MRLGIVTDVHGNTEALHAVFAELDRLGVEAVVHLGDVLGYGAEPNECCEILRARAQLSLMGNHDAAVVGAMDTAWFASHARAAVDWTIRNLSDANLEWVARSPYTYREGPFLFSHGSPVAPHAFKYVLNHFDAENIFGWLPANAKGVRAVLVGHAHQCIAFEKESGSYRVVDGIESSELDLSQGTWVVNVGSVGQPRDGDPRAAFAVLDTETARYRAYRVAYDFKAAGAKILAAGLPEVLSARLAVGR